MSAQPDHTPVTPYAATPGAQAELLAQLRADRRSTQWVPAFERKWAAALEESRRTFSLAGLYAVIQDWMAASPPPLRSTRSSLPATTTASSSTWPSSGKGDGAAGDRTAAVLGSPIRPGRRADPALLCWDQADLEGGAVPPR